MRTHSGTDTNQEAVDQSGNNAPQEEGRLSKNPEGGNGTGSNQQPPNAKSQERSALADRLGMPATAEDEIELNGESKDQLHRRNGQKSRERSKQPLTGELASLIRKAIHAKEQNDQPTAGLFYDMYRTLKGSSAEEPQPSATRKRPNPRMKGQDDQQHGHSPGEEKDDSDSDNESEVGDLKFISGAVPKHDKMGFTPYFNKNIKELKGPLPLTIFNKSWKNAAILYHAEKQARIDDVLSDQNRYTGYPYPSEWKQSFAE
ncbi:hypothetical protein PCASD_10795 [Puccinia coronata f. sp. avenae]|uniref:Uncharacterized protein n=1 Tax=Puccinia coronata f. sp. avenae TaxID=200324 RepID=A0A2N5ULD5_9BASI|nr:hypothetical protein PCASD_10795 [Puccinia coronata f. sp. avenae]